MEQQTNGNTFFEVKTMKKRLFAGLILICFAVIGFLKSAPAQSVLASNEGVLRLHVIAASDSEADQSVKLQVRDAILPLFSKAESYEDARTFLLSHGHEIQSAAEAVLKERGFDYGVQLSLGTETFPDRVYGDLLFPAGSITACSFLWARRRSRTVSTATSCFLRASTTRCACGSVPPRGTTGGACCFRRCAS